MKIRSGQYSQYPPITLFRLVQKHEWSEEGGYHWSSVYYVKITSNHMSLQV